ncbi:MAG: hypothetical protein AAGB34_03305 [Planctomycetota bacterium]
MFNPNDATQMSRLRESIRYSRRKMQKFRDTRLKLLREYVGSYYADGGAEKEVPVNMIGQYLDILSYVLASGEPRGTVGAMRTEFEPVAWLSQEALNVLLGRIGFGGSMERCVRDALLGFGMTKSGMAVSESISLGDETIELGQPFCESVDIDDAILDMSAREWDHMDYVGDRFLVPLEEAQNDESFDEEVRKKLKASNRHDTSSMDGERAESISNSGSYDRPEIRDYVELAEVYLPKENLIITMVLDGESKPLSIREWEGHRRGPYSMLSFNDVARNILPVSPGMGLKDLHDVVNSLARKMMDQSRRGKQIYTHAGGQSEEDAERINTAVDGECIRLDDPSGYNQMNVAGMDQQTLAAFIQFKNLFSAQAGNLEMLGGLGAQSETVGQDRMLSENANRRVADMNRRVVKFVGEAIETVFWYLWNDPLIDLPLTKRLPEEGIDIPVRFAADTREGDVTDYEVKVQPHSLTYKSPSQRLQGLLDMVSRFVLPMSELLMQQGGSIDVPQLIRSISRLADMPELERVVSFQQPLPEDPPVRSNRGARGPYQAETKRTYERVSRPGATKQGAEQVLLQQLMGGNPQQSEKDAAARSMA